MKEMTEQEVREILQNQQSCALLLYTPFCGTCKVAERMLVIVEQLIPELPQYKLNLNLAPAFAGQWQIASVPCVLRIEQGEIREKLYAVRSVEHLYQFLKTVS